MELLPLNVCINQVSDVIKRVLNKLTKHVIQKLPSVGTKSRFMSEDLILSQLQVAEGMLKDIDKDKGNC